MSTPFLQRQSSGTDRFKETIKRRLARISLAVGLVAATCTTNSLAARATAEDRVADTSAAILAGGDAGTDWASYGRTYSEQHASPLKQINSDNVSRLGLAWSMELPGVHQGATVPLEVDGIIYFTVDHSRVRAVDAATGKLLWLYDPHVGKVAGVGLRFSYGSRGIAYWNHKVYVGTADGRLIAIDAGSGQLIWSAQTTKSGDHRSITGAPRAFEGMVLVGHAGAEAYDVRGYVTAYDAETGARRWRFFTVPGDPKKGFENSAMAVAAKTWNGKWWKYGGGGTVWNAITYDPDLDQVYIGTGNGLPWNRNIRSPGGGDNLFICSIVALDAKTGKYKWHYQTTPGDEWDYDSTTDLVTTTMNIRGNSRKVLFQANKNGFFYIIDRTDGKLISADKFAKTTWADRVDLTTGRPVENPSARYNQSTVTFWPGATGAHNWTPMAFNKRTGLVYIPTMEMPGQWNDEGITGQNFVPKSGQINTGLVMSYVHDVPTNAGTSALLAWDPAAQKPAWKVATPLLWNGGVMTTEGDLVFQGNGDGWFNAYDARTGKSLWKFYADMGISGAPITYSVNGKQYVTVIAGWGSAGAALMGSLGASNGWISRMQPHRLLTFVLDGTAKLPANLPTPSRTTPIDDPAFTIDPRKVAAGGALYSVTCVWCHGVGAVAAGFAPDLLASTIPLSPEAFKRIVHQGIKDQGMPDYPELTETQLESLRHFIRSRAREDLGTSTK